MNTRIATNIETSIFNSILEFLPDNGWKLDLEYAPNLFDKGIDFDLFQFSKDNETILLVWNNWFEGEIMATPKTLDLLEKHFLITFQFGQPEYANNPTLIADMSGLLEFKNRL